MLGALNYSMPEHLQVDDQFIIYLRDNGISMQSCFCFTDVGQVINGNFIPSPSQIKMQSYGVPHTLHEIYLSSANTQLSIPQIIMNIQHSVEWIHKNILNQYGESTKIIINIVDACDAFAERLDLVCQVLEVLATLDIEGVSIEDDRGTFLPFQITSFVEIAKIILPANMQLLVHLHNAAGVENAATLDALLAGASGVWGSLPKAGGIAGHASLGELIANLVRIGNVNMNQYNVEKLVPVIESINALSSLPCETNPLTGKYAYSINLEYFKQKSQRFMDLTPDKIGSTHTYRICPVMSDPTVISGRLREVENNPDLYVAQEILEKMIQIMRQELREGHLTEYDSPENLIKLYQQAQELNNDSRN